MTQQNLVRIFDQKQVRSVHDTEQEKWFVSVIDVIAVLTGSENPRKYWSVLKTRLKKEGSELATNCSQLKMQSADGKYYKTDVADLDQMFRLIQSIPSPKAEPFKLWLAQLGRERLEEIENPQLAQERMKFYYEQKGYPEEWIAARLRGMAVRQNLTDEWKERGITEDRDYAILTAEISRATFGIAPHDRPRADLHHARRAGHDRNIPAGETQHVPQEQTSRPARRTCSRKCPARSGARVGSQRRIGAEFSRQKSRKSAG